MVHKPSRNHEFISDEFSVSYYDSIFEETTSYAYGIFENFHLDTIDDYKTFEDEVYDYLAEHGDWHEIKRSMHTAHLEVLAQWLKEKEPSFDIEVKYFTEDHKETGAVFANGIKLSKDTQKRECMGHYTAEIGAGKSVTLNEIVNIDKTDYWCCSHSDGISLPDYFKKKGYEYTYTEEFDTLVFDDLDTISAPEDFQNAINAFMNKGGAVIEIYNNKANVKIPLEDILENASFEEYGDKRFAEYVKSRFDTEIKNEKNNIIKE